MSLAIFHQRAVSVSVLRTQDGQVSILVNEYQRHGVQKKWEGIVTRTAIGRVSFRFQGVELNIHNSDTSFELTVYELAFGKFRLPGAKPASELKICPAANDVTADISILINGSWSQPLSR